MSFAQFLALFVKFAEPLGKAAVAIVEAVGDAVANAHPELDDRPLRKAGGLLDDAVEKAPE